MNTSEGIKPEARCIKGLHPLSGIKHQQLQTEKARNNVGSIRQEVVMLLGLSLILCLITVIGLGVSPSKVLAKFQRDIAAVNDTTLYNKGLILFKLDNYTGAIKYFDKVLAINPDDVNALTDKGLALDALGNHTSAIEYYVKALGVEIVPHDVRGLISKGVALGGLSNYTAAIEYFDKVLAIDPQSVDVLSDKGIALHHLGN